MKKAVIILSVLALIISGCGQATKKQEHEQQNATTQSEKQKKDTIPSIQFDGTQVIMLKNKTLDDLKKKNKPEDKIIMNFLNEYSKLVDKYNGILVNNKNYDLLNDAYLESDVPYDLDFVKEVKANGFDIDQTEGQIYIEENTDFIKSDILSLVDSVSTEFINLYCHEIEDKSEEDAGIIITQEEIVKRVYNWGELSEKVSELEYKNSVEDGFYSNLNYLFYGLENTPSFDFETKKYNQESIDFMNKIIEKSPKSRAAEEFKPFIELLEDENFEKTQKVEDYWKTVQKRKKTD